MTKTYIKGKDEALEVSIEKMQTQLKVPGFDIEEALWLNPVSNIFSVNLACWPAIISLVLNRSALTNLSRTMDISAAEIAFTDKKFIPGAVSRIITSTL